MEAVNYLAELLVSTASATDVAQPLHRFMEKTHWKAQQFEFELRTELQRLAAVITLRPCEGEPNLPAAFETMMNAYQLTLASSLTAHARAMITRQSLEMRIVYEEFAALSHAA